MTLPERVLIANRGEVAVRIVRTLRRLGVASVVIHHAVDRDSLAVREADEAIEVFGPTPVAAYLDIDSVVAAALNSGADAVHPGFGFLSERAAFAEAVTRAGVSFVGPPPGAIRAMGDKIESKRLAALAGVPVVPGSDGALATAEAAVFAAAAIGYPVLLKASAGGGGKGMRVAHNEQECADAFAVATAEAQQSFGDGRVFLERYLTRPRHIEVQILADGYGNTIHLGERECSIQRRYQKVIEEAPSPFVDMDLRAEIGERACTLAKQVGYVSAGTVEMVMDADHNYYFLEMNTRLQVEHPVTECVTGIDIVEQQLRIAGGEPLPYHQNDVRMDGHAIEARVYAEDADHGNLPATGRLHRVRFPDDTHLRVDTGVRSGDDVTSAFDPMIAKVIAHADSRAEAAARLRLALQSTVLLGVTTNLAYLARILAHPRFLTGETTTDFLATYADDLTAEQPTVEQARLLIAAAALAAPHFDFRYTLDEPLAHIGEWRP